MPDIELPKMAQGPAVPASPEETALDDYGFTNPNLHRRIPDAPPEVGVLVAGVDSYRTVSENFHDEESTTSEVP